MLILLSVVPNSHECHGRIAIAGRIIVSGPDLHMIRHRKELAAGSEEIIGTATGEVTASGSNICVEDRIAAKHVICRLLISQIHSYNFSSWSYLQSCSLGDLGYDQEDGSL